MGSSNQSSGGVGATRCADLLRSDRTDYRASFAGLQEVSRVLVELIWIRGLLDSSGIQMQSSRMLAKRGPFRPVASDRKYLRAAVEDACELPALRGRRSTVADVILVGCVKTKQSHPAPAQDLYVSALFEKARGYAEQSDLPWFILSAEHGLLEPHTWISPYDRYLKTMSLEYREAWGRWVRAKLLLHLGDLRGQVVEVHASEAYVDAVRVPLEEAGATVTTPLAGLTQGRRLAWYGRGDTVVLSEGEGRSPEHEDHSPTIERLVSVLSDASRRRTPHDLETGDRRSLQCPGLYSWWVDASGAAQPRTGRRGQGRDDLRRPSRGDAVAQRRKINQHAMGPARWHAPRWEIQVLHFSTHARIGSPHTPRAWR